jgi:four helix bundle protein
MFLDFKVAKEAEGCSRKSVEERNRFYEIARGSLIEANAASGIVVSLKYSSKEKLKESGVLITRTFQLISGMIS